MATSPPGSPTSQRPVSAMLRRPRSSSRMSMSSKHGGGSRASDEDGKTSVKVVVRVRPPLKPNDPGYDLIPQRFQRSMVQVTTPTSLIVDSPQGRKLFVFDRIFNEDVDQDGVWDYLGESVNAFIQGYNVSLLAYGQSGAGKSYTMGTAGPGEQNDPKVMGVIPRAASSLFEKLESNNRASSSGLRAPTRYSQNHAGPNAKGPEKNWVMKATYVEIYNEQLRDLLVPDSTPPGERNSVTIREDAKGRILLTGLHQVTINTIEDLLSALHFGSSIRQTDATAINAKSSRSHAVFSLNLVQRRNKMQPTSNHEKRFSVPLEAMTGGDNWVTVDSKLHFVDLAGSERLKNTGAQGERAKEGISINAGLASLGKVISQLSSRQAGSHVSYRDSKLTRLLQDSLGGNAITYMIACVTPAEFHLSETLNTVQYAQRARAIQSKPRIQQTSDEGDKQAVIDRLKAEIAFLREQIRNSERGDRRSNAPQERAERSNEREIELQNHLLDIQENYSALSQRHAKLISEITKARDSETAPTPTLDDAIGDSAVERLRRSNSFAEAVEQVVLEYEKTIQSLESSLSSTRSSLASTESTLLEKETKCAYIETVNQQLQARVQKMMDRESSTENYLHDLEDKLDGHTSGEEKNAAIVMELRKEIARVRENEASCEDYISTLEERLAEADQDTELMQREIDRLEHVVERQRSLGKLDNLLYELDHVPQDEKVETKEEQPLTNGESTEEPQHAEQHDNPEGSEKATSEEVDQASDYGDEDHPPEIDEGTQAAAQFDGAEESKEVQVPTDRAQTPEEPAAEPESAPRSPAQQNGVADKLDNVTQELLDLRTEHDTTVNEYDMLSAKYEEALRTLAELQDAVDEARHIPARESVASASSTRPTSFLGDGKANEMKENGILPSSRYLSSELSLAGESPSTPEPSEHETVVEKSGAEAEETVIVSPEDALAQQMEDLKNLQAEKEENMVALTTQYAQLQEQHQETLDVVEELKFEIQKSRLNTPTSPTTPVIRRKSSQNVMTIDRAHRSFASLRNIAAEYFEDQPDTMQNFEVNLNAAMHELHSRSERVQVLEAEIASVRKEMETKMTIISGLTRERSSMNGSSPMDISVVSSMRDQLLQSENEIHTLRESHVAREQELLAEIQSLTAALEELRSKQVPTINEDVDVSSGAMPGDFPETPMPDVTGSKELGQEVQEGGDLKEKRIADLEKEVNEWEGKHQNAIDSMQASEKQLNDTIVELETAMRNVEALRADHSAESEANEGAKAAAAAELEQERLKHQEIVNALQTEIETHKATIGSHADEVAQLERSLVDLKQQLEESANTKETSETELTSRREFIAQLEQQIEEQKSLAETHQETLATLSESHARELEELRTSTLAAAEAESEARLAEESAKHEQTVNTLQGELSEAKRAMVELLEGVSATLKQEVAAENLQQELGSLVKERDNLLIKHADAAQALEAAKAEAQDLLTKVDGLEKTVGELTSLNEESVRELERLGEKEKKSSRLVEELEEQLASNFDQHQAVNNRLSTLQTERSAQLDEAMNARADAEKELENYRNRVSLLEGQISDLQKPGNDSQRDSRDPTNDRSNSISSNLRKSASVASLPSPPPAIPLPPLPGSLPSVPNTSNGNPPTSPTASRHPSKDLASTQLAEDQEARIRTIEKHLFAEKQLTATLEEALVDLETQGNKVKADMEMWKKKAWTYEDEIKTMKKERNSTRYSLQAVEEERNARMQAEAARAHLEERMNALNKKKKKSTLNCF